MSEPKELGRFGTILVALMTDESVLSEFLKHPYKVMDEFGISQRQKRALYERDADQIDAEFALENPGYAASSFVRGPSPKSEFGFVRAGKLPAGFVRSGVLLDHMVDEEHNTDEPGGHGTDA